MKVLRLATTDANVQNLIKELIAKVKLNRSKLDLQEVLAKENLNKTKFIYNGHLQQFFLYPIHTLNFQSGQPLSVSSYSIQHNKLACSFRPHQCL